MEKTLKLSSEEWEGANYIKGKETSRQREQKVQTSCGRKEPGMLLILRKVRMPKTKPGRKECHEI